ncbi:MAG: hypoxanthine phosphoribosyltransferase [Peptococcaceae bacterium]|nr:hypoxanthine phosphoribosyltransferase [Candidatus Syntrophopropionicum ammoniitolerans]
MHPDCERVLISEKEIQAKVAELGRCISNDYAGKELLMIGVLKGAAIFLADLVREIAVPTQYDFMALSSYGSAAKSSGRVRILKDLACEARGRHIIIVEDIVDTGLTMNFLAENLCSRDPASVKICTLLDKPSRRIKPVEINYKGFVIPDKFVVGYGLDYGDRYRNIPCIMVLSPKIYMNKGE